MRKHKNEYDVLTGISTRTYLSVCVYLLRRVRCTHFGKCAHLLECLRINSSPLRYDDNYSDPFLDEEFYDVCDQLKTLTVAEENPKYKVVDGVLFSKDMKTLIAYPCNYIGKSTYIIPDGVVRLGRIAFRDCKHLKEITCPANLTEVGASSFYSDHYSVRHYDIIRLSAKQVVRVRHIDPLERSLID